MTRNSFIRGLFILAAGPWLAILTGCLFSAKAGEDLVRPEIRVNATTPARISDSVCGAWYMGAVLPAYTGENIVLDLEFSDDHDLAQYKIDIHANFDCHSHAPAKRAASEPWTLIRLRELAGRAAALNDTLRVPDNAPAGDYHLILRAVDAAGNEAPFREIALVIRHRGDSVPPTVILESPFQDTTFLAAAFDSVTFRGELRDARALAGGRLELSYRAPSGTEYTAWEIVVPVGTDTSFAFERRFRPAAFLGSGLYRLELTVFDALNNAREILLWARYP